VGQRTFSATAARHHCYRPPGHNAGATRCWQIKDNGQCAHYGDLGIAVRRNYDQKRRPANHVNTSRARSWRPWIEIKQLAKEIEGHGDHQHDCARFETFLPVFPASAEVIAWQLLTFGNMNKPHPHSYIESPMLVHADAKDSGVRHRQDCPPPKTHVRGAESQTRHDLRCNRERAATESATIAITD